MTFNLVDVFHTIQGEGINAGRAALFIRLPFCNLACPWCDTEFNKFKKVELAELHREFSKAKNPKALCVITGGEPTFNKQLKPILTIAKEMGFETAVESNGQFLLETETRLLIDTLTVSPKKWKDKTATEHPLDFVYKNKISELKLVVDSDSVFKDADRFYKDWVNGLFSFRRGNNFFLSPEWGEKEKWIPKIVDYVKEKSIWRISLQTHKIMDVL